MLDVPLGHKKNSLFERNVCTNLQISVLFVLIFLFLLSLVSLSLLFFYYLLMFNFSIFTGFETIL